MINPSVTFRLSTYQLGRGLRYLRQLEPSFHPTSPAHIVKQVFLSFMAQTSINCTNIVSSEIMEEIYDLLEHKKRKETTFEDFIQSQANPFISSIKDEKSIIRTVTNFSPPTDWLLDEDN